MRATSDVTHYICPTNEQIQNTTQPLLVLENLRTNLITRYYIDIVFDQPVWSKTPESTEELNLQKCLKQSID